MAESAQTLIESAVELGYDALSDRGLKECLLFVAQEGGGGGGGQLLQGDDDPTDPPDDPDQPAYYTNRTSGVLFFWNTDSQAWE